MKIFNIEKPERLYNAIADCSCPVKLVTPEKTTQLAKNPDAVAKEVSYLVRNGRIDEIELIASSNDDNLKIMRVLMGINAA